MASLEAVSRGTIDLKGFDNSPRWWIGAKVALFDASRHRGEHEAMLKAMGIETGVTPDTIGLSGDVGLELAARWYIAHAPDKIGVQ